MKKSMEFEENDYLMLSGIQHFLFCRRQWALIHVENQWEENDRTAAGSLMHKKAHDVMNRTKRNGVLTVRGMRVRSSLMGVSGECDVVEFHISSSGVPLAGEDGLWQPYPVEYKRGTKKPDIYDEAQLCAQAICLEEMLCCSIHQGALYYGQDRRRQVVEFTPELREKVMNAFTEMHHYMQRGITPKTRRRKACNACSVEGLCLPHLEKAISVEKYLKKALEEDL